MSAQYQKRCFQCMETFQYQMNEPNSKARFVKMNLCSHQICIHCLKKIQQKSQNILSCGFCGVIVKGNQLKNMIQNCRPTDTDLQLSNIIIPEAITLQEFSDQRPQTQEISFLLGSDSYKDICQQQHIKKIQIFSNLLEENTIQIQNKNCRIHQKAFQIVCLEDKKIICAHCAIFGQHKGHNVIQLNVVEKQLQKKKIKIGEIMAHEKQFSLRMRQKQLKQEYMHKILVRKEEDEAKIKFQFENLRELLKKTQDKAIQNLRKCYNLIEQKLNTCLKGQKQLKTAYQKWADDTSILLKQISLIPLQNRVQMFLNNFTISSVQTQDVTEIDVQGNKYFQQMKDSLQVSLKDVQSSLDQVKMFFDIQMSKKINNFVNIQFRIGQIKHQGIQDVAQSQFSDNSFVQNFGKTLNVTQSNIRANMMKSNFELKSHTPFGSSKRLLTQANFSQTVKFAKSKSPKVKEQHQLIKRPLKYNRKDILQDYNNINKKVPNVKSSIDCEEIKSTLSITEKVTDAKSLRKSNHYKNLIQKTQRQQVQIDASPSKNIKFNLSRCKSNDGPLAHTKKQSMDTMDSKFTANQFRQPIQILQQFRKSDSQVFDLSNCNLQDSQIIYYLQRARKFKKIKNLKLSANKISPTGFQKIIPLLGNCALLNISHNFLTQQVLDLLFKKRQKLPNLKMINISNNKMNSDPKKLKSKLQNLKKIGIMITL